MATHDSRREHLSLRVHREVQERLKRAAKRSGTESRSALAARLIDEGLRMEAHPGITFRSGPGGRRPGLVVGPDVWEVARVLRDMDGDLDHKIVRTADLTGLPLHAVRSVASYYAAFAHEIDEWIADVDREADEASGA